MTDSETIPTSLVGSYPQPDWLIDRESLGKRLPPRLRARELWRIDPKWLRDAQDDAVLLAIRDQERAGLDILTDGEMRRESYSNVFANALSGVDLDNPGTIRSRAGTDTFVPRVTGPVRRRQQVHVADVGFLRAHTNRPIKVTVPGPFTMSQQAVNDFYEHDEEMAFAYADAVREEIQDLFAAGADIVQLDEPWLESRAEAARRFAMPTLERALDGVTGTTALHVCFGYPTFVPDRPAAYHFLTELGGDVARPGLDRDGAARPRSVRAGGAALKDDHPRGDRARQPRGGDPESRRRAAAPGTLLQAAGRTRGRPRLRDEVPAPSGGVREARGTRRRRPGGLGKRHRSEPMTTALPRSPRPCWSARWRTSGESSAPITCSQPRSRPREFRDPFWHLDWDDYEAAAVVQPATVEEIQAIVRIANEHRVPLWTTSTGRNNGYGGSSPRVRGSVVVNLRRMNRVLEINEELGYAVVEPGVRWFDLYEAIQAGGHG